MVTFEEIKSQINILLVDDDTDYIDLVKMYFGGMGYNIDIASTGEEAIEMVKRKNHQIILLDYFMPGMSGEDVVNSIRQFNQQVIIIMQTGFAGQKPPIDTMKKLNIQNFHDKTEGIEKLNLELISAVKIFQQQNAISVAKFKTNAISKLISSIASNIKESLMSISGSIELTNMMVGKSLSKEDTEKLNTYYDKNKKGLEKIDKVLTTIINEVNSDSVEAISDKDIIDIVESILENEMKERKIDLKTNLSLRTNSYITGDITDLIFVICEIILRTSAVTTTNEIEFVITEDEEKWYFEVHNPDIGKIDNNTMYVIKNVVVLIKNTNIEITDKSAVISIIKK